MEEKGGRIRGCKDPALFPIHLIRSGGGGKRDPDKNDLSCRFPFFLREKGRRKSDPYLHSGLPLFIGQRQKVASGGGKDVRPPLFSATIEESAEKSSLLLFLFLRMKKGRRGSSEGRESVSSCLRPRKGKKK